MAKDNKAIARANRNIQNLANGINQGMDDLYRSTYLTTPQQGKDLRDLGSRINSSIDNIVNRNMDTIGMPSVSKLYTRIAATQGRGTKNNRVISELESLFDNGLINDDIYSLFMSNRYLKELDNEIDTVCKYMPKLEEALLVQKDCVLSADHFSKDFINITSAAGSTELDGSTFAERISDLKKKYKLAELVDHIYEETSKYGEKFVYRVPYSTAIARLLATKANTTLVKNESTGETREFEMNTYFTIHMDNKSFAIKEATIGTEIVSESATHIVKKENKKTGTFSEVESAILGEKEQFDLNIEICKSGIIESAVANVKAAFKKKMKFSADSMNKIYEQTILRESGNSKTPEAKGNLEFDDKNPLDARLIANDGLVTGEAPSLPDVKAPGCVIQKLPRENVIPIYIDDMCMGYYYFEVRTVDDSESFFGFKNILGDPLTNMRGDKRNTFNSVDTQRQDDAIKYVAGQLSGFIDKQFVNNNQDLAKEIYMILKYNDLFNTPSIDRIKVTFVPPEDMVHFYFRLDPQTHRGISDLDKSLVPAKIYSSLYITNSIGILTRGQDKRAYYVKQTVDTNIAQTLLNTIAQIKQGNFGIRQFQNINNILNITGRFNDFVIPTNASGDPPISVEVIPGQEFNTYEDLLDKLEEMAINSTGIPIEIIQARQSVDYAMQLTMSSSKVLRFCYKRQELFEDDLAELIGPLYNYEYRDTASIEVKLPPPSFINVTNTNQLVDNTKTFVNSIVEVELANEDNEALKNEYTMELIKHYLGSHLDIKSHEDILNRCRLKVAAKADESHTDDGGF